MDDSKKNNNTKIAENKSNVGSKKTAIKKTTTTKKAPAKKPVINKATKAKKTIVNKPATKDKEVKISKSNLSENNDVYESRDDFNIEKDKNTLNYFDLVDKEQDKEINETIKVVDEKVDKGEIVTLFKDEDEQQNGTSLDDLSKDELKERLNNLINEERMLKEKIKAGEDMKKRQHEWERKYPTRYKGPYKKIFDEFEQKRRNNAEIDRLLESGMLEKDPRDELILQKEKDKRWWIIAAVVVVLIVVAAFLTLIISYSLNPGVGLLPS